MKRDKIIEKVKKLREHSVENGATEAEAMAFALKAQKLLADQGIEAWELGGEPDCEIVEIESRSTMRRAWRKYLLAAIAENFRCKGICRGLGARRGQVMVLIGRRDDAEAAMLVYEHLLKVGHRLGKEHEDDCYTDPDAYENFVRGFTLGVNEELERQCRALMLVRPQAVDDYLKNFNLKRGRGPRRVKYSEMSVEAGRKAGHDAMRSRRIGSEPEVSSPK